MKEALVVNFYIDYLFVIYFSVACGLKKDIVGFLVVFFNVFFGFKASFFLYIYFKFE